LKYWCAFLAFEVSFFRHQTALQENIPRCPDNVGGEPDLSVHYRPVGRDCVRSESKEMINGFVGIGEWITVGQRHDKGNRKGTPQGGGISPLLSNIYLHFLDRIWERQILERLGLTLNEAKTRIVNAFEGKYDFLGFTI